MMEVVFTIDRYRGDCSLDAWTSTLAARVVYKQIRRRRVERRVFDGVDLDVLHSASSSSVSREAMARSALKRIVSLLQEIDEAKAWTYVLHDVCGYDLKEIAQITDVSIAAAQTRLVRGRREVEARIAADPELKDALDDLGGVP